MGQLGEAAGTLPTPGADEGFVATFSDGGGSRFSAEDLKDGDKVSLTLHERKKTHSDMYNKDQIQWDFAVEGFDVEEYGTLRFYTSFSMHEKSKLPGLLKALGAEPPTQENPTINVEVGATCKGIVKHVEKKNREGETKTYPRLDRLVPA